MHSIHTVRDQASLMYFCYLYVTLVAVWEDCLHFICLCPVNDTEFLRQVRMTALMPNKKGHNDDDSNDDDVNSHVTTHGNTPSSQGDGQQSGSGQKSGGSQDGTGHHQGLGGGGSQESSRGGAGQGSSSGGDGNDEEDKEKIKQPKAGDRQNEVCTVLCGLLTTTTVSVSMSMSTLGLL